jgi:ABC-2 type transport system permease protein
VLIYALCALDVSFSAGKAALLVLSILGASCMFYGLVILQATAAFWTTESLEIMNTVTYGGTETGSYPLAIYRRWFRKFFTFVVPLACVNYYPVLTILGRNDGPAALRAFGWLSPSVGVVFLILSLRAWRFGIRRYRSTGS